MRKIEQLQISTRNVVGPETFAFEEGRGWKWIQRICFRILDRIGCASCDRETIEVFSVRKDHEKLDRLLIDHVAEVRRHTGDFSEGVFLMGKRDTDELFHSLFASTRQFGFHHTFRYCDGLDPSSRYLGCKIIVVPWMSGSVFVTEKMLGK